MLRGTAGVGACQNANLQSGAVSATIVIVPVGLGGAIAAAVDRSTRGPGASGASGATATTAVPSRSPRGTGAASAGRAGSWGTDTIDTVRAIAAEQVRSGVTGAAAAAVHGSVRHERSGLDVRSCVVDAPHQVGSSHWGVYAGTASRPVVR